MLFFGFPSKIWRKGSFLKEKSSEAVSFQLTPGSIVLDPLALDKPFTQENL